RRINVVASADGHVTMGRMMQMMRGMSGGVDMGGMLSGVSSGNIGGGGRMPKDVQQILAQGMSGKNSQRDLDGGSKSLNLLVDDGGHRIPEIVKLVNEEGVVLESVELHKPTLDDVFLSVTGRNIRDERGSFTEMVRRYRIVQQARGGRG
ncbi:MAG: hypothetical protein OEY99_06940, partial [Aigarchaeota archaeon]|nr:hypothetical protein [Aigarchaeota archaeon]